MLDHAIHFQILNSKLRTRLSGQRLCHLQGGRRGRANAGTVLLSMPRQDTQPPQARAAPAALTASRDSRVPTEMPKVPRNPSRTWSLGTRLGTAL